MYKVKKNLFSLFLGFFLSVSQPSVLGTELESSVPMYKNDMLWELDALKMHVNVNYAPKSWKNTLFAWDMNANHRFQRERVLNDRVNSVRDFQQVLRDYLKSTRDFHVNTRFHSTELSFYPLLVEQVEERYFVRAINLPWGVLSYEEVDSVWDDLGPQMDSFVDAMPYFPIHVGDELIAIDGMSMYERHEELVEELYGENKGPTSYALAASSFFLSKGSKAQRKREGNFSVTVIHQGMEKSETYTFSWLNVEEKIIECPLNQAREGTQSRSLFSSQLLKPKDAMKRLLIKDRSIPGFRNFSHRCYGASLKDVKRPVKQEAKGSRLEFPYFTPGKDLRWKGELPPLGEIIWDSPRDAFFYAYIYKTPQGKSVGYLHIPSFAHGDEEGEILTQEFASLIRTLQRKSDAMVLDLKANPGGYVFYTYSLLSMLIDEPMETLMSEDLVTQADIFDAIQMKKGLLAISDEDIFKSKETILGYPLDVRLKWDLIHDAELLLKHWNAGEGNFMVEKRPIHGIFKLYPSHNVRYTKPIIVLVDELGFSCTDLAAAMMQDSGRATLFGKKTAGAGGSVVWYQANSRFGLASYSLTRSLDYRSNGEVIENIGVEPDIPCELTIRDLRDSYIDYIQTLNQEVDCLLP